MADKKKKSASLGCLFWIAFILLIIVLFFFNRKTIESVMDRTGLSDVFAKKPQTVEKPADPSAPADVKPADPAPEKPQSETKTATDPKKPEIKPATKPTPTDADTVKPSGTATQKPAAVAEKPAAVAEKPTTTAKPAATTTAAQKPAAEKPIQTRKSTLYFVTIDSDGRVLRKEVAREVAQTDSPLSETLTVLFKGTTPAESAKGLRSLVPQGTRLLSATVRNGVATLNLSEEFQFNQFGIEGYLGQLAQIVFTATSFPSVTSVQFLIEGQRKEYLGAEGVWIGTPLSRDTF